MDAEGSLVSATVLQPFGPNLWLADGPQADVAGFCYPTRMAVVRLSGGGLWIWSPVALSDDLRSALSGLGEVRFVVAPNTLHHLFLPEWRKAFPNARVHAAPGLTARAPTVEADAELTDGSAPEWADDLDQVVVGGNRITAEVVFFHRNSATVLFTDLIQQFPAGWFTGWRAWAAKLDLMVGDEPSVPRKFRLAFTDRRAARTALRRILAWPSEQVVMAHGAPVRRDGRAFIGRAFGWLRF